LVGEDTRMKKLIIAFRLWPLIIFMIALLVCGFCIGMEVANMTDLEMWGE